MPSGSSTNRERSIYSVIPVFGFLLFGLFVGFAAMILLSSVHKHSHNHAEIIVIAAMFIVPPFLYYNWAALRQAFSSFWTMVKNLYWYHWVFFVLFMSMQVWRKRTLDEIKAQPVDTFAAARALMVAGVGCYLLYRLFTRKTDFLREWFSGVPGFLMLFVLAVLTSMLWSVYWPWTLYKGCEYAVDVATVAAVVVAIRNLKDLESLYDWTWFWIGMLLFTCWLGAYFAPDVALSHLLEEGGQATGPIQVQLSGVFPDLSANRVGEYSAIIAAVALVRLLPVKGYQRRMTTWYTWLFIASLITIVFAQTRSATGGFLVAVVLIFWLSGRFKHGVAIVLLGATLLLVSGGGSTLVDYMKRGQSTQQLESLTGRIQWWELAFKKYEDAPLTGFGGYAAGRFLVMGAIGNNVASMHSDWVETLVGVGFWGIVPLLFAMGTAWWYLLRFILDPERTPEERQLCLETIAVFTVASMRTIFSDDLTWHSPLQFMLPFIFVEYMRHRYGKTRLRITAPAYIGRYPRAAEQ
ncbi:MAG TPA: O-antigen ligase family protein [Terriglobales bacterium]|nr:O-antigen ligase family protein [Terriglobales bacterium]